MITNDYTEVEQPKVGDTVLVGLSGGVDSTTVALLLKERGCKVIGVTMSLWDGSLPLPSSADGVRQSCYCPDEDKDIEECQKFCDENQIEYHVIDVKETYKKEILEYFKTEYRNGRTPNPCIRCNRLIKFGAMLEGITKLGINYDYFCTGHYARLVRLSEPINKVYGEENCTKQNDDVNLYPLMIQHAKDMTKDQAYFLYRVSSKTLEKVRFPLGDIQKKEVFKIANSKHLLAASRQESQDFIPPEYFDIIFSDKESIPGDIIDLDGKKLGRHKGIENYTIGQRRGLGVSSNKPLYVHSINKADNTVVLASNDDLLVPALLADDWVWAGNYAPRTTFKAFVKIRLASKAVEATISFVSDNLYRVEFSEAQRAVAPGQSVVVYSNDITLGGGIIKESLKE